MKLIISSLIINLLLLILIPARSDEQNSMDGYGVAARFNKPADIAVDRYENLYVPDMGNNIIRKISPTGEVSTLAGSVGVSGSTDGMKNSAKFFAPAAIAVDRFGYVYVADTGNHTIRKITPEGLVTTLAGSPGKPDSVDGVGPSARFNFPYGVAIDNSGNVLIADAYNHTIRKITTSGAVTTLAGIAKMAGPTDGPISIALLHSPNGVAVDNSGNIYDVDMGSQTVRKITPGGMVITLAGTAGKVGSEDGIGLAARFNGSGGIAVDNSENVYVADRINHTIRKITPSGTVKTLAGNAGVAGNKEGTGSNALFCLPTGVAVSRSGNVYIADEGNNTIRKISPYGAVTTLAGNANGPNACPTLELNKQVIQKPTPIAFVKAALSNISVAKENTQMKSVPTLPQLPSALAVAVDTSGNLYISEKGKHSIRKISPAILSTTVAGSAVDTGSVDGMITVARFNHPNGVAIDSSGNIFVADSSNHTIRKVSRNGLVTTFAGSAGIKGIIDGISTSARFDTPSGVAVDNSGNVYIADTNNSIIRKITTTGEVSTLAGSAGISGSVDGAKGTAKFNSPKGISVDSFGNLYVTDTGNHTIRKISPIGIVTTFAGSAGEIGSVDGSKVVARFNTPYGVAIDSSDNIYIADNGNNTIRKITPEGGVTTFAGSAGLPGNKDGIGNVARFNSPIGMAVDSSGNVYVADDGNSTIRKISTIGKVSTLGGEIGSTNNR